MPDTYSHPLHVCPVTLRPHFCPGAALRGQGSGALCATAPYARDATAPAHHEGNECGRRSVLATIAPKPNPKRQLLGVCQGWPGLERHLHGRAHLGRCAPSRHKSLRPTANIGYVTGRRSKAVSKSSKRVRVGSAQFRVHQRVQQNARSSMSQSEYIGKDVNASLMQLSNFS